MQGLALATILFLFFFTGSSLNVNVVSYGAVGDGRTDDSQAFLKAWNYLCNKGGRAIRAGALATFLIPEREFLLNPVSFSGPCIATRINVQLNGDLSAPMDPNSWPASGKQAWISFSRIRGLTVTGGALTGGSRGHINGHGSPWWSSRRNDGDRPTALAFHDCQNLNVTGVKHSNSQRNHITINNCDVVEISHFEIWAPADSPNTDGIDISRSNHVNIHDAIIGTGDDCVAINGFSSDINITRVTCGPGHGISVGSLGKNGAQETVSDVRVNNCTFINSDNGMRIKTWEGGSGYATAISFVNIQLINARNAIIIDQHYYDSSMLQNGIGVKVSSVTYRGVYGTTADEDAITLRCANIGCSDISFHDVNITSSHHGTQDVAYCQNAQGVQSSTWPHVPCMREVLE